MKKILITCLFFIFGISHASAYATLTLTTEFVEGPTIQRFYEFPDGSTEFYSINIPNEFLAQVNASSDKLLTAKKLLTKYYKDNGMTTELHALDNVKLENYQSDLTISNDLSETFTAQKDAAYRYATTGEDVAVTVTPKTPTVNTPVTDEQGGIVAEEITPTEQPTTGTGTNTTTPTTPPKETTETTPKVVEQHVQIPEETLPVVQENTKEVQQAKKVAEEKEKAQEEKEKTTEAKTKTKKTEQEKSSTKKTLTVGIIFISFIGLLIFFVLRKKDY